MQSDVLPPPLPEKHRTGDQSELDAIIFELKMELAGIELNVVKYELIFLHEYIIKTRACRPHAKKYSKHIKY